MQRKILIGVVIAVFCSQNVSAQEAQEMDCASEANANKMMAQFSVFLSDSQRAELMEDYAKANEAGASGNEKACQDLLAKGQKKEEKLFEDKEKCVSMLPKEGELEQLPENSQARVDLTLALMEWARAERVADWERCLAAGEDIQTILEPYRN